MDLFGRHMFGREAQKSPAEMPGIVKNPEADRQAEADSEAAWNRIDMSRGEAAGPVSIKATVATENVDDNVVELPMPETPSSAEQATESEQQLPPANVAS